jgi:hypothetical protein
MQKNEKTTNENGARVILLLFVVIITSMALRFSQGNNTPDQTLIDDSNDTELTEELCTSSGGTWNECGSACRGADDETVCIQVCVAYCECQNSEQCPANLSCSDFIDGQGICTATN